MSRAAEHAPPPSVAKHIVLLGPLYPYRGGIAHFMGQMHRGLQDRGHRTTAITFSRQFPALLFPGQSQFERTQVSDAAPAGQFVDSIDPISWFRTTRYIRHLEPDAVIFQYWMPFFAPAFGTIARRLRKHDIPSLAVVHNAIPHERRPGDFVLGRYFLDACSGLLVMSEAVEQDLDRLGVSTPRRRIAHPVYDVFGESLPSAEARERLGLPLQAPVLLFFGFIRRYKGLMNLLDSLPRVLESLPDLRLVIAGECYEDATIYRERAKAHHLEDIVLWRPEYIPSQEVATYFSAADVVVQPYESATQSGVAQIAYHFDRPLIVTDVGSLAEIVPHGKAGLVVPPGNTEALSAAIVRFFEEGLGPGFQAGVREEKQKYSWDRLYEAIEDML